jgi:hypothetical protein
VQRVLHTASSRTPSAPSCRSINPAFAAKLDDIVGRYVASPKHTVVLSVNENSRILALDRT